MSDAGIELRERVRIDIELWKSVPSGNRTWERRILAKVRVRVRVRNLRLIQGSNYVMVGCD